ncbi:MAG: hypothetical protein QM632_05775 [Micrococcaceae bacterium]
MQYIILIIIAIFVIGFIIDLIGKVLKAISNFFMTLVTGIQNLFSYWWKMVEYHFNTVQLVIVGALITAVIILLLYLVKVINVGYYKILSRSTNTLSLQHLTQSQAEWIITEALEISGYKPSSEQKSHFELQQPVLKVGRISALLDNKILHTVLIVIGALGIILGYLPALLVLVLSVVSIRYLVEFLSKTRSDNFIDVSFEGSEKFSLTFNGKYAIRDSKTIMQALAPLLCERAEKYAT